MTRCHALTITDSHGNTQTINCNRAGAMQVLAIRARLGIAIVSAMYRGEQLVTDAS